MARHLKLKHKMKDADVAKKLKEQRQKRRIKKGIASCPELVEFNQCVDKYVGFNNAMKTYNELSGYEKYQLGRALKFFGKTFHKFAAKNPVELLKISNNEEEN